MLGQYDGCFPSMHQLSSEPGYCVIPVREMKHIDPDTYAWSEVIKFHSVIF